MNPNNPPTEHILACLSSSPSNAKIVRTAATMAKAFGGTFTALYVRTPDSDQMGKEDCRRLQQHIRMAEQAGADNREKGGKERTPHSAQGGSGNLVAAGYPLEGQDEVHACHAIGNDGL